jgi:DNA-binding NarL/FixJ family response regulator
MKKYRCIAIDDDPLFLEILEYYIQKVDTLELIETYSDPTQGAVGVVKHKPDLLFLDIEMPYLDGYETIYTLENKPKIVIISSHLEYETDLLKIDVSKFVRKPLSSPEQLAEIVEEVMNK